MGHGGLYHSQDPTAYFTHTPGLIVVVPRDPITAKGLLLASIRHPDPVLFFEPKALYRASVAEVPEGDYEVELGKADVVESGSDVTLVSWGSQVGVMEAARLLALEEGISCELIDLQTLLPWDVATVEASVRKTGRLVVSHEAPRTSGFGAEIASSIQERCFLSLEAPVLRVCGYDTPFPVAFEKYYVPDKKKVFEAIKQVYHY